MMLPPLVFPATSRDPEGQYKRFLAKFGHEIHCRGLDSPGPGLTRLSQNRLRYLLLCFIRQGILKGEVSLYR